MRCITLLSLLSLVANSFEQASSENKEINVASESVSRSYRVPSSRSNFETVVIRDDRRRGRFVVEVDDEYDSRGNRLSSSRRSQPRYSRGRGDEYDDRMLPRRSQSRYFSPREGRTTNENCNDNEASLAVAESFNKLAVVGDREFLFSDNTGTQQDYCTDLKKSLALFDEHVHCLDKHHRQFLSTWLNGFKESVNNRCHSKCWKEDFLQFSRCMKKKAVRSNVHVCSDKLYAAFAFIERNVRAIDQIPKTCCLIPHFSNCLLNATLNDCGHSVGFFLVQMFMEPIDGARELYCPRNFLYRCQKDIELQENFHRIFDAPYVKPQLDGFYKPYFKLIKNTWEAETIR